VPFSPGVGLPNGGVDPVVGVAAGDGLAPVAGDASGVGAVVLVGDGDAETATWVMLNL
jgi:hypothetical protein